MFIGGGEPITIKRRSKTSVDEYGNPTYSLTTIIVREALIALGGTSESNDPARTPTDAKVTLYLPNGTQILDGDRLIIRDTEWVKDGEAQEWNSPFPSSPAGVVVNVKRRRG